MLGFYSLSEAALLSLVDEVVTDNQLSADLAAPSLTAVSGDLANIGVNDSLMHGDLALPAQPIVAGNAASGTLVSGDIAMPAVTLNGLAQNALISEDSELSGAFDLPSLDLAGRVVSGELADVAMPLPSMTMFAEFGKSASLALPHTISLSGGLLPGTAVKGVLALPRSNVNGSLIQGSVLAGAIKLPKPKNIGGGFVTSSIIVGNIALPKTKVAGVLIRGVAFAANLPLPTVMLDGDVAEESIILASFDLPSLTLKASAYSSRQTHCYYNRNTR